MRARLGPNVYLRWRPSGPIVVAIHESFALLAQKLIKKNGRPVSIKTTTRLPVDAAKPWDADGTPTFTTTSATAVFLDPEGETIFEDALIKISQGISVEDRTSIVKVGTQVWIAAKDVPNGISTSDTLVDGLVEWQITSVQEIKPGPTTVAFRLRVSR